MTAIAKSYPQTYTTIARALKYCRTNCWNSSQLAILDRVIDTLADDFSELNPRFNVEQFKTMAAYYSDRPDNEQIFGR